MYLWAMYFSFVEKELSKCFSTEEILTILKSISLDNNLDTDIASNQENEPGFLKTIFSNPLI